jgi:hypothetical protein
MSKNSVEAGNDMLKRSAGDGLFILIDDNAWNFRKLVLWYS